MHVGVLGMTQSGKTLALKAYIERFKRAGYSSILLDPLNDPEFNVDFQTSNQYEFIDMVFKSKNCLVIVDETGEQGKFNIAVSKLATKGRHWGHTCIFAAQKATQVNTLVRDQWGAVMCFTSGAKSGILLAEEFNCQDLKKCTELRRGEYMYKTRFDPMLRGNIFDEIKKLGLYRK